MLTGQIDVADNRGNYNEAAEMRDKVMNQQAKNKLLEAGLSRYAGGRTRLEVADR